MADEDNNALTKAVVELEYAAHEVRLMDSEPDWERLIKAAEDILKLAGAR